MWPMEEYATYNKYNGDKFGTGNFMDKLLLVHKGLWEGFEGTCSDEEKKTKKLWPLFTSPYLIRRLYTYTKIRRILNLKTRLPLKNIQETHNLFGVLTQAKISM